MPSFYSEDQKEGRNVVWKKALKVFPNRMVYMKAYIAQIIYICTLKKLINLYWQNTYTY